MRLTLVILLVVGTASLLASAQDTEQRRQARARFRALAQAARNGDTAAQDLLKSRRRARPRQRPAQATRSSAVPSRPVFQDAVETPIIPEEPVRVRVPVRRTRVRVSSPRVQEVTTFRPPPTFTPSPSPEPVFPETVEPIIPTDPVPEAPIFEPFTSAPVTEAPEPFNFIEETPAPAPSRSRFRPQSRPVLQSRPVAQRPAVQSRPADDFSINFELEPHKALNTGLEVDSRSEHIIPRFGTDRTTEPPVETIRRYSYFDEEGNYVFGYEAADGSFKEEVRGLDCVVNGKYGYVDPEGIRREFTYTSGNKCDPNAVVDPETQEVPAIPLNDQFLQQTQETRLTQEELEQIQFNRRRRPVKTQQPQEETVVRDNRRRRPSSRPSARPIARPAPRPVQEPQPVFRPVTEESIAVTPAPAPLFTTPSSFNRFTTPPSLRPVEQQEVRRPRPRPQPTPETFAPQEQQEVRRPQPRPQTFAPEEQQVIRRPQPTHQAFVPPEGPSFRPTPKPISFDFDREFNNLFTNFAKPRPVNRAPVFTTPRPSPKPITRPPPPPTTRPPPPPPPPSTFQPVTAAPATSSDSNVANQLVFDSATGTFKNVPVKAAPSNNFLPRPAPNPFAPRPSAPSPSPAPRPASPFAAPKPSAPPSPPQAPSTVGRPLPIPTQPAAFNPASHFVINQNGRSPSAAEFDKFFSQFNLKF